MTDLISRLERAPEGSRALSDEVLVALCGYEKLRDLNHAQAWYGVERPDPSRSVDDALQLVPEGPHWRWLADRRASAGQRLDGYRAHVWCGNDPSYEETQAWAATAPLALCVAVLKAMRAGQ